MGTLKVLVLYRPADGGLMHVQDCRHVSQSHGPKVPWPVAKKSLLAVHNAVGAGQQGAPALLHATYYPPGLAQLSRKIIPHLSLVGGAHELVV